MPDSAYLHERRTGLPAFSLQLPTADPHHPGALSAPVHSSISSPNSALHSPALSAFDYHDGDSATNPYLTHDSIRNATFLEQPTNDDRDGGASSLSDSDSGGIRFVNETMESLREQIERDELMPRKKRVRTSSEQLNILLEAFAENPMPEPPARTKLAQTLGMTPRAVQIWFQNRRAKTKLESRRGSTASTDSVSAFMEVTTPVASQKHSIPPTITECAEPSDGEAAQDPINAAPPVLNAILNTVFTNFKPHTSAPREVQRLRPAAGSQLTVNTACRHASLPDIHQPSGYLSSTHPHSAFPSGQPIRSRSIDYGGSLAPRFPPNPTFAVPPPPSPSFTRRPSLLRSPDASPALQSGYVGTSSKRMHHPYFPSRVVSRRHSVIDPREPPATTISMPESYSAQYGSETSSFVDEPSGYLPQVQVPTNLFETPSPLSIPSPAHDDNHHQYHQQQHQYQYLPQQQQQQHQHPPNHDFFNEPPARFPQPPHIPASAPPLLTSTFTLNGETFNQFLDEHHRTFLSMNDPSRSSELAFSHMDTTPHPLVHTTNQPYIKLEPDSDDGWSSRTELDSEYEWATQEQRQMAEIEAALFTTTDSLQQLHLTSPLASPLLPQAAGPYNYPPNLAYAPLDLNNSTLLQTTPTQPQMQHNPTIVNPPLVGGHRRTDSWLRRSMSSPDIYGNAGGRYSQTQ